MKVALRERLDAAALLKESQWKERREGEEEKQKETERSKGLPVKGHERLKATAGKKKK